MSWVDNCPLFIITPLTRKNPTKTHSLGDVWLMRQVPFAQYEAVGADFAGTGQVWFSYPALQATKLLVSGK